MTITISRGGGGGNATADSVDTVDNETLEFGKIYTQQDNHDNPLPEITAENHNKTITMVPANMDWETLNSSWTPFGTQTLDTGPETVPGTPDHPMNGQGPVVLRADFNGGTPVWRIHGNGYSPSTSTAVWG